MAGTRRERKHEREGASLQRRLSQKSQCSAVPCERVVTEQLWAPSPRPHCLAFTWKPCLLENTLKESEGKWLFAAISNQLKNTTKSDLEHLDFFFLFLFSENILKCSVDSKKKKSGL